jgi:hypothetical protein
MPRPFLHYPENRFFLPLVLIIGIAFIGWFIFREFRAGRLPYKLVPALFTPAEQQFLAVLRSVLPSGVDCYGKVRLIDICSVENYLTGKQRQTAVNRVAQKHVDFLLVRSADTKPLLAIELDDKSHQAADRKKRDIFLNQLFADVKLPLIRIPVQRSYNASTIREMVVASMPPAG